MLRKQARIELLGSGNGGDSLPLILVVEVAFAPVCDCDCPDDAQDEWNKDPGTDSGPGVCGAVRLLEDHHHACSACNEKSAERNAEENSRKHEVLQQILEEAFFFREVHEAGSSDEHEDHRKDDLDRGERHSVISSSHAADADEREEADAEDAAKRDPDEPCNEVVHPMAHEVEGLCEGRESENPLADHHGCGFRSCHEGEAHHHEEREEYGEELGDGYTELLEPNRKRIGHEFPQSV